MPEGDEEKKDKCGLVVIGSDTVVSLGGKIYGKPKTEEEAKEMLRALSGKEHQVYSGVCVFALYQEEENVTKTVTAVEKFHEATDVKFAELDDAVIEGYVATGEPMDKAGAYGIQAVGGTLVESIRGDFFNVMGFPLHRFCCELVAWFRTLKLL